MLLINFFFLADQSMKGRRKGENQEKEERTRKTNEERKMMIKGKDAYKTELQRHDDVALKKANDCVA